MILGGVLPGFMRHQMRLEELICGERSEENLGEIVRIKLQLNMEMDKEERYWEQRARANWLKMGDKNTASFHKYAYQRSRVNQICGLQRLDSSIAMDGKEVESIVKGYFFDLFMPKGIGNLNHILSGVHLCTLKRMNRMLLDIYSEGKIIESLKGMGPTKASGADGFPVIFYQKYWHIIGKDTSDFCLGILNNGSSLEEINKTQLVLIPKTANPTNLKNYRPISLLIRLNWC
ncbi:hypothetical protein PVK06_042866 [Gossypium arboreum]|uniref:Reverse transcriptase n=1 Tax=Gossypium arboreum TaxID=29729 RepID=A0ABR0MM56_GOSAR|nr:hypothetical protein PVK06_042866 [Gossypium arboreum]